MCACEIKCFLCNLKLYDYYLYLFIQLTLKEIDEEYALMPYFNAIYPDVLKICLTLKHVKRHHSKMDY